MPASNLPDGPVLALERAVYAYQDGTSALDEVTFAAAPGESLAIVGANGCGKSTLLKALDGLLPLSSGRFLAFGDEMTADALRYGPAARAFRRRVALVFQNADVQLFSPTVRDDLAFGPLQLGMTCEEALNRADEVARLMGIERLLDRPPFRLSEGEKRRAAVASALTVGPDVLLLDEPTASLDPRSIAAMIQFLLELRRAGKTLVTATHDLDMVAVLADRVVVFGEDHRLAGEFPASELADNLDLLVRANVVHSHVHRHGALTHSHPHFHAHEHEHEH